MTCWRKATSTLNWATWDNRRCSSSTPECLSHRSCCAPVPGGLLQAPGAVGGDSPPVPCSVPSQRGNGDWGSQRPAAAPCCVLGSQTGILAQADSTAHHVFGSIEGKSSTSLEAEHCCPCSPRGLRWNIASGISAHNCFSSICLLGHTKQSETHPKTEFVTLLPPAVNLETRAGFLMGRGVRLPPPHQHPGVLPDTAQDTPWGWICSCPPGVLQMETASHHDLYS